jgi:hypothetical protein
MIAKSLIAAAAVAGSALAFAAPEASAKTNWDIQIGLGLPVYEERYYEPRYVYEEPAPVYRYRHRPRVEYVYEEDHGISCKAGKRVVRSAGFRDVQAYDCSAPTYGYSAWRHGDLFKVRLNSEGDIISVRQID